MGCFYLNVGSGKSFNILIKILIINYKNQRTWQSEPKCFHKQTNLEYFFKRKMFTHLYQKWFFFSPFVFSFRMEIPVIFRRVISLRKLSSSSTRSSSKLSYAEHVPHRSSCIFKNAQLMHFTSFLDVKRFTRDRFHTITQQITAQWEPCNVMTLICIDIRLQLCLPTPLCDLR